MDDDSYKSLVASAQLQIERANNGNVSVAREVLRQAAVGLRDLLHNKAPGHPEGKLPDPERCEYLSFLLGALEQIDQGVAADKALGLWSENRPSGPDDREFALWFALGHEVDKFTRTSIEHPLQVAIAALARQFQKRGINVNAPTIEKAWKQCGGMAAWDAARGSD